MQPIKYTHLQHYFLLCFSFLFYGCIIVVLGPVIPFLSEWYDLPETSFTYLFICRSVGFCFGSILMTFLLRRYSYYPILRVTVVIAGLMFILFPFWRSLWGHGFCIVVASMFCSGYEIVMNMCIIALYKHNRVDFWLQIMHGMFGVGGLIGPLFVRAWGVYGCVAIGIGCIVSLPGYFLLPTPESAALEQQTEQQKQKQQQYISDKVTYMLQFMFFMYFGQETGFGGWISTYTVMMGFESSKGATIYPAIFWLSMTIFRFGLANAPGTTSQRLKILTFAQIACYGVSVVLVSMGFPEIASYWNSILIGACYSSMYALLFSLSLQFGQQIASTQAALIMMLGAFGEGALCTFIGLLMEWFGPNTLFVFLGSVGVVMLFCIYQVMSMMKHDEKSQNPNQIELKQRMLSH